MLKVNEIKFRMTRCLQVRTVVAATCAVLSDSHFRCSCSPSGVKFPSDFFALCTTTTLALLVAATLSGSVSTLETTCGTGGRLSRWNFRRRRERWRRKLSPRYCAAQTARPYGPFPEAPENRGLTPQRRLVEGSEPVVAILRWLRRCRTRRDLKCCDDTKWGKGKAELKSSCRPSK